MLLLRSGADHAPFVVIAAREADVEALHVAGEIPVRIRICLAAEHPDRHFEARKLLALEFDRVDARDQADRLMRDQVAVQQAANVGGVAALRVLIVVGDKRAEFRSIALLGGDLCRINQRADLVLGSAGRCAASAGETRCDREARRAQDRLPTAAGRP